MKINYPELTLINKTCLIIFLSILFGCGKVPTKEPNQPFEHFVGDFETANLNGFHFLVPDTSINTKIITSPVRKGNYALKNTLRPYDYINNGFRAELSIYNCAKYRTEVYYGLSFMIDTAYSNDEYNLICQWQDLPNYDQGENWEPNPTLRGSSPPIALVYVNGKLEIKMNENPNSNRETFLVGNPKTIIKGVWNDIVAHVYWNENNSAYIEVWLNGILITPFNGTDNKFYRSNLFNRSGNYFKFGQYRGKNKTSNTNIIYFDEIKTGSTYSEVAP